MTRRWVVLLREIRTTHKHPTRRSINSYYHKIFTYGQIWLANYPFVIHEYLHHPWIISTWVGYTIILLIFSLYYIFIIFFIILGGIREIFSIILENVNFTFQKLVQNSLNMFEWSTNYNYEIMNSECEWFYLTKRVLTIVISIKDWWKTTNSDCESKFTD